MIICDVDGKAGDTVSCPVKMAAATGDDDKGIALQFKAYPTGEATFEGFSCVDESGNDSCANTGGPLPTGHTVAKSEKSDHLFVMIFDFVLNYINDAVQTTNALTGNPNVLTINYKLTKDGKFSVKLEGLVISDKKGKGLGLDFQDGIIITSKIK
jgi:hypothetical protein